MFCVGTETESSSSREQRVKLAKKYVRYQRRTRPPTIRLKYRTLRPDRCRTIRTINLGTYLSVNYYIHVYKRN